MSRSTANKCLAAIDFKGTHSLLAHTAASEPARTRERVAQEARETGGADQQAQRADPFLAWSREQVIVVCRLARCAYQKFGWRGKRATARGRSRVYQRELAKAKVQPGKFDSFGAANDGGRPCLVLAGRGRTPIS